MRQPTIEVISTDILILGSGGAGLFAALHAFEANPRAAILICVKGLLGKSGCTRMVQGATTPSYTRATRWTNTSTTPSKEGHSSTTRN
jgi:succinate dehydrogenase/fumarate reductase flavoprotein subunit